MKRMAIVLTLAAMAGCTSTAEVAEKRERLLATTPSCSLNNRNECERKWQAAQSWVAARSLLPIVIASDAIIETARSQDTELEFRVTKVPVADDGYIIMVAATCANLLYCFPSPLDAELAFNESINTVAF